MDSLLHDRCHPTSGRLLRASPVMPEQCTGRSPDTTQWAGRDSENLTYCQSSHAYACARCGYGVEEDHAVWDYLTDRPRCANDCHWHPCTRAAGCSWPTHWDGVHMRVDCCAWRMHDLFKGNEMAMPNHAPWPNPCTKENQ